MRLEWVESLVRWLGGLLAYTTLAVLLDEWFFFDDPEPRMCPYRWIRPFPLWGKSMGIFHYRLGAQL